jgi:hypothetical protein
MSKRCSFSQQHKLPFRIVSRLGLKRSESSGDDEARRAKKKCYCRRPVRLRGIHRAKGVANDLYAQSSLDPSCWNRRFGP